MMYNLSFAQDTTIHELKTAVIVDSRYTSQQTGYKSIKPDTLIKKQLNGNSLSELIAYDNSFFIKNYGANGIASSSIRGGNASQSTINWKGFNINSPMLGQTDLSIVPAFFFNNVAITYGGNACLAGSGSIGGSVFLGNNVSFQKEIKVEAFTNYASFGFSRNGAGFTASNEKFYNATKVFVSKGSSNYKYGDTINGAYAIKQLNHTQALQYGLLQENGFKINKYQKIELSTWLQKSNKELPNTISEAESRKYQYDACIRTVLNWQLTKSKFTLFARTGLFMDKLDYIDSTSSIFSKSNSVNSISEIESKFRLSKNHILEAGINFNHQQAQTKSYVVNPFINKYAAFTSWQFQNNKKWFKSAINLRQEAVSTGQTPFVWSAACNMQPISFINIRANVGKVFRLPTLNDMYWNPGGNPRLQPEQGFAEEIGVELKKEIKKITVSFDVALFNRNINNWISWLPSGGGFWSPVNVLEVWSRGCETQTNLSINIEKIKFTNKLKTNYVLSTYQKAINENDGSVGRQLIYTPIYSGSNTSIISYKGFSFLYLISYTGYRYLSSDNYQYLKPYWLNNLSIQYQFKHKQLEGLIFSGIDNLLNKNYQVVANNPMPLRYFKLGLNIKYQKIKS